MDVRPWSARLWLLVLSETLLLLPQSSFSLVVRQQRVSSSHHHAQDDWRNNPPPQHQHKEVTSFELTAGSSNGEGERKQDPGKAGLVDLSRKKHEEVTDKDEEKHEATEDATNKQKYWGLVAGAELVTGRGRGEAELLGGSEEEEVDSAESSKPEEKEKRSSSTSVDLSALQTYLRLEFELPLGLTELRDGPLGPLPRFLAMLRSELAMAAETNQERVALLDVRGAVSGMVLMMFDQKNTANDDSGGGLSMFTESESRDDVDEEDEVRQAVGKSLNAANDSRSQEELLANRSQVAEEGKLQQAKSISLLAAPAPPASPQQGAPTGTTLSAKVGSWAKKAVGLAQVMEQLVKTCLGDSREKKEAEQAEEKTRKPGKVVVDLELRPGRGGEDPTAEDLFKRIEASIAQPNSKLMRGPVGELVANGAELRRGGKVIDPPDGKFRDATVQRYAAQQHVLLRFTPLRLLLLSMTVTYGATGLL